MLQFCQGLWQLHRPKMHLKPRWQPCCWNLPGQCSHLTVNDAIDDPKEKWTSRLCLRRCNIVSSGSPWSTRGIRQRAGWWQCFRSSDAVEGSQKCCAGYEGFCSGESGTMWLCVHILGLLGSCGWDGGDDCICKDKEVGYARSFLAMHTADCVSPPAGSTRADWSDVWPPLDIGNFP